MIRNCISLAVFFLLFGCSTTEPCEENSCFTPPPAIIFEILDAETGKNLYSDGTLKVEDIVLLDKNQNKVNFQFYSENGSNLLYLNIGWEPGTNLYRLILNPNVEITISLHSELKEDNCCSYYVISDFSISEYDFERSATTGNYKVFIKKLPDANSEIY